MTEVKQTLVLIGIVVLLLPLIVFMVFGDVTLTGRMRVMSVKQLTLSFVEITKYSIDSSFDCLKAIWTQNSGSFELLTGFEPYVREDLTLILRPITYNFKFNMQPINLFDDTWLGEILDVLNPVNLIASIFQRFSLTFLMPIYGVLSPARSIPSALLGCYVTIDEALNIPEDGIWGDKLPDDLIPPFGGVEID